MTYGVRPQAARALPRQQREKPNWRAWLACLLTGLVLVAAVSELFPAIRHQWALSLRRQDVPYTELAFTDGPALPAVAVAGQPVRVAFRVTNDASAPQSYRYVISSGSGGTLHPLRSSSETVRPGEPWTVDLTVLPRCAGPTCRIQVALPAQDEQIYFLLTLKAGASGDAKHKQ